MVPKGFLGKPEYFPMMQHKNARLAHLMAVAAIASTTVVTLPTKAAPPPPPAVQTMDVAVRSKRGWKTPTA